MAIGLRLIRNEKTGETHIRSILTKLHPLPQPDDHRRILGVVAGLQRD